MKRRLAHPKTMLLTALAVGSILFVSSLPGTASDSKPPQVEAPRHPRGATLMKRQWGVEILDIHLTSAGYMLHFRFKVIDAKKAAPLFDRKIKPYLVDTASGAKFIVPSPEKVGQLRSVNPPEAGRIYSMLFANPAKMVKQGNRVEVVVGNFRAPDLTVE